MSYTRSNRSIFNIETIEEDFKLIANNQFFTDKFGNFGKIDSLEWLVYENRAILNYRINQIYTNKLIQTKL